MNKSAKTAEPPNAILVFGPHEFFVDEAAEEARAELGFSEDEIERIPEEELAARLPDALASGSLFSSRRLVEADLSSLFGRDAPGGLAEEAAAAWQKDSPGGRREAFKKARALLAALQLENESPDETAASAAKKVRRPELRETLEEIFRELPGGAPGNAAAGAVLAHLAGGVPGTVLLARAVDPPRSSALYKSFDERGSVRAAGGDDHENARLLAARARKLAAEKGVAIEPAAIERLRARTAEDPRLFASELEKLLEWAGENGKIAGRDVDALVEDRRAEDVYAFFDALGSRDRTGTMRRLEAILSGRALRTGEREIKGDEPLRAFFGMLAAEIRRLLIVRARCEETRTRINPALAYGAYQSGVHPRLASGTALLEGNPFLWYKAYQRAGRFTLAELVRALRRCADADAATKDSASLEDTIALLVSEIVSEIPGA